MIMKPLRTFLAVLLLVSVTAQGGIYSSGTLNTPILDADPTGISSDIIVSGSGAVLNNVSVLINVSGGYNGDLTAYLTYNGNLVPLLNRVGTGSGDAIQMLFGYSTAGFDNVRLSDVGSVNIHDAITPGASPTSYHPDGGNLAAYNGSDPNGTWTIFFADMASSGGSSSSTLVSWSLDVTAVPEPVNVALGILAGLCGAVGLVRSRLVRDRLHRCLVAIVQWVDAV